jgi:hypothetical protein
MYISDARQFLDDKVNRIVDSASRFSAQGGRWRPDAELAQRIGDAALGRA